MKAKLLLVLIALTFVCPIFGQSGSTKRVAILETVDKEGKVPYGVKLMVRSKLNAFITATPGYEGYDRVDVSSILGEQEFQRTGLVGDDDIKQLGEMTGADYILVAEVAYINSSYITLFAKIINVENGRIEQSADVQSPTTIEDLVQNCRELAGKLLNVNTDTNAGRRELAPNNNGYGVGSDFVETAAGLNMKMVWVEGGEFLMGGTTEQGSDADDNEKPVRRVKLDSYYIGECEVTQAQWEKVMGTSIHQQASEAGYLANYGAGPDYPMYYISWEEAQAFCSELSRLTERTYRLPTEAQWEYAARGGKKADGTKYSGSWSIDAVAWCSDNSGSSTHPVKSKQQNGLGLYDMSGNAWEWCSDWYGSTYNENDTNNPTGPSSDSYRVLRGGSWNYVARFCRVSSRRRLSPGSRLYDISFRVVVLP